MFHKKAACPALSDTLKVQDMLPFFILRFSISDWSKKVKFHSVFPVPNPILPAMQFQYSRRYRKSQSGPLRTPASHTVKFIPYPGQILLPDAVSLIINTKT